MRPRRVARDARPAGRPARRTPLSCHAGAPFRSFRWTTSRRDRRRAASARPRRSSDIVTGSFGPRKTVASGTRSPALSIAAKSSGSTSGRAIEQRAETRRARGNCCADVRDGVHASRRAGRPTGSPSASRRAAMRRVRRPDDVAERARARRSSSRARPGWSTSTSRTSLRAGEPQRRPRAGACAGLNAAWRSSAPSDRDRARARGRRRRARRSRVRRRDGEEPAVGRPVERGRQDVDRRAPDDARPVARRAARSCRRPRRTRRCEGAPGPTPARPSPRVRVEQVVAVPVAGDDAQPARARGRRSACRSASRPSAASAASARASVQRTSPSASSASELVRRRRDDVEPVRRPLARPSYGPSLRLKPFVSHEPDAAAVGRDDEQPSGRRQREERRLGVLDPDRLAHALEDGPAGRREHGGERPRPRAQRRRR